MSHVAPLVRETMANGARCILPWIAMDPATSYIRAVEFTPSRDGDGPMLPDLLGQIPNAEQMAP